MPSLEGAPSACSATLETFTREPTSLLLNSILLAELPTTFLQVECCSLASPSKHMSCPDAALHLNTMCLEFCASFHTGVKLPYLLGQLICCCGCVAHILGAGGRAELCAHRVPGGGARRAAYQGRRESRHLDAGGHWGGLCDGEVQGSQGGLCRVLQGDTPLPKNRYKGSGAFMAIERMHCFSMKP